MANIDLSAQYVLKSELLGSPQALASTPLNDSLILQPLDSSNSNQLWFFTTTVVDSYFRLHTINKGNYTALDVDSYIGRPSIALHFYATQDLPSQYWHLSQQSDGSVKLSNKFAGPDIYLDLKDGSGQPALAGQDSPGQRWTLSIAGSTPTSTSSTIASSTSGITSKSSGTSPTGSAASSTCTAACALPVKSNKLSRGAIGGIVSGIIVAFIIGILLVIFRRKIIRKLFHKKPTKAKAVMTEPGYLNA